VTVGFVDVENCHVKQDGAAEALDALLVLEHATPFYSQKGPPIPTKGARSA
jgi:hypothetical protein